MKRVTRCSVAHLRPNIHINPGAGIDTFFAEAWRNQEETAALVTECRALLDSAQARFAAYPNDEEAAAFVTDCRATLADAQHIYRDARHIYRDALIDLGVDVALHAAHSQHLPQQQKPSMKHSIRRRSARAMQQQQQQHHYIIHAHYTCQDCGHEWEEPITSQHDDDDSEGGDA